VVYLAERLGFGAENVIAMGDSPMDLPMIHAAGLGIAMKNANEHVRLEADMVTEYTNEEDGVGRCLMEVYGIREEDLA